MPTQRIIRGAEFITETIVGPKLITPPFMEIFKSRYPLLLQSILISYKGSPKTKFVFKIFSFKDNSYHSFEITPEFLQQLGLTSNIGAFPFLLKSDEDTNIHTIVYEPHPFMFLTQSSSSQPSLIITVYPDTSTDNMILYTAMNMIEIYNMNLFISSINNIFGSYHESTKTIEKERSNFDEFLDKLLKKLDELKEKKTQQSEYIKVSETLDIKFTIPESKKDKKLPHSHLVEEKYGLESMIEILKEAIKKLKDEW